jgi:hypothetical protein
LVPSTGSDHGHRDEPLYWSIPETLLGGCGLATADSMDIAELHRLVRDSTLTLIEIAQRMAVPIAART